MIQAPRARIAAKHRVSDNLVLIAGVALPVVLMTIFFIAGRASDTRGDAPRYDAVIAVNYDEGWPGQPWRIELEHGQLVIRLDASTVGQTPRRAGSPELHLFDHATLQTSRLDIDFDSRVDGRVRDPDLDALNARRLIAGPDSPDGYRLERRRRTPIGGLLGDLLGVGRNRSPYVLRSATRTIPIRSTEPMYQARLIAWVEQ